MRQVIDNKIQKDQKTSIATYEALLEAKNRVSQVKAENCMCPLHTIPPKGWENHLKPPLLPDP